MSGRALHVYVVTPYQVFFDAACEMLSVPASDGELGVMYGHAPVVTALYPGELRIRQDGRWRYAFVSNGYVQIERSYVMVVCNSAEWAEDIDPARARLALERAEKRYADTSLTPSERKRAAHAIRRAKKRFKVIEGLERRKNQRSL